MYKYNNKTRPRLAKSKKKHVVNKNAAAKFELGSKLSSVKEIQVAAAVTEDETETPRRDLCCTVRKVLADFAICD